ncbi:MAG: hypothetical protein JO211_07830, partial [Acidobacteriaceae bacterium]|nr:hypothetical protein [Acidobacteriaceae bacterium]
VKNIERKSRLLLACADGLGQPASLAVGEQTQQWSLQQLSQDQLFLSFDTSNLPAGCALQAVVDNGRDGKSQPFTLAHMIRMPQIDSFAIGNDAPVNGNRSYVLTGQNLEMIENIGWDQTAGLPVAGIPVPLPGPGQKQSLQVSLPDPPAGQPVLYVWLRGDKQGRATTIKVPALPAPAPAPPPPPHPGVL